MRHLRAILALLSIVVKTDDVTSRFRDLEGEPAPGVDEEVVAAGCDAEGGESSGKEGKEREQRREEAHGGQA